jgi:tape measure domain-containing protein
VADPKIRYDIEAGITGEADVRQLEGALRGLGDTLDGDLKQEALGAADALKKLGDAQAAIDNFTALKRAGQELSLGMSEAAAAVDKLGAQLPQAAASAAAFAEAEVKARIAAAGAKADLDEQRLALQGLRAEYTGGKRATDEYKEANAQLLQTVKDLRTNFKEKSADLAAATVATRAAQTDERALANEYEKSVAAAKKLSIELGTNTRALEAGRATLSGYGIETSKLQTAEKNLAGAVEQVREKVTSLAPAFAQAAAAGSASANRQAADQRTVRDGVKSVGDELRKIQSIAAIAIGGSIFGGMIKGVADTADEFKNLQARVKLATGEGDAFTVGFKGIQEIALATNSTLENTGTLFARLAKAGTDAGLSSIAATQQALSLTKTINQSVQLSGSSAEASSAAITQLIQGLQSGVLRGDEFNSVMEQAPRLAQALAQGIGVTTGALREMAEQGALTSATVIRALTTQSATVASEFANLPATVGRSLQNLSTAWTQYVGEADKGIVSSANVAKIIDALARNLDTLVATLYAAGKAYAAVKVLGLASDVYKWATATAGATVALEANTVATAQNTIAHGANAAAQRAGAAAAGSNAAAVVASTGRVAAAGGALGRFSALLGPVGVGLAVLAPELVNIGKWVGETAAKWAGYGKVLKDAEDRTRLQAEATKSNAEQQRLMAIALDDARNKQFQLTKEASGLIGRFDEMRLKGDSAAEAIGKIGKDFDLASVPGIANAAAVLDKLAADGKLSATQFQTAWSDALKGEDLAVFETKARAAFAGATREGERLAAVFDGTAREAIRRTGLEFDVLAGGIGKASRSAINDTDAIINSLDRLKAQGVDTGLALTASISKGIETADSAKAIEALRAQIESVRSALGDKVADGLLTQAGVQADALKLKIDQLKPGIQSATEALRFFGLQGADALRTAANSSREAYDTLKNSGLASANQLREAFTRVAADAIAANKGMAPSWLTTEDAILRAREATENFGKSTSGTLGRLKGEWQDYGDTVRREGSATPGLIGPDNTAKPIKSVTGDTREERLSGQNAVDASLQFQLRDKLQQGTLGADDIGALKAVIASLKQQNAINGSASRLSAGFQSTEGIQSAREWERIRSQFEQALARLENPQAARSTTHNVKLELPTGQSGALAMASEGDAQTLVDLLGRLKGRSS